MNKIKHWFLISILSILILFITPTQQAHANEAKTYKVGAFNNSPVIFKDADGSIQGMYVDLLTEIGQKENIKFEYVYGTWAEGLERIKSGEVDLLTSVGFTTERIAFMDYTKNPLLTVWGELYNLKESQVGGILDVAGKKVGVLKGDINFKNFKELTDNFEINCQFVEYLSYDEVFQAVQDKNVDVGVAGITFGAKNQTKYNLKSTGVVFNPLNIYFTTAKGKNRELMTILDSYLIKWKGEENSFFDQTKSKWMYGFASTANVAPPWIINTAIILGAALLIVTIFVVILKHQVNQAMRKISKKDEDLIDTKELYSILSEQSPIAIELYNAEGILQRANPACLKLFGITDIKEISKFSLFEDPNISADTKIDLKQGKDVHYQAIFDFDKVNELKLYHTTKSGSIWLDITITTAKEANGYLLQILDITELKKNSELLNTDRSRISLAMKVARMGVWEFDIVNNKRDFDDQVCELLGINPSTFKGSADEFFQVIHPDDLEKLKNALSKTIEEGADYKPEYRVVWPDKSIHVITARGKLVSDKSGKPLFISGIVWDITNEKENTEKLLQQYNLVNSITENTNEAVYAKEYSNGANGKYIYINEAGAKMLGYKASDMIGRTDSELMPLDIANEFSKNDQLVISSEKTVEQEEIGVFNGVKRFFLSHKSPWKDKTEKIIGIVGTSNDITDKKKAEEDAKNRLTLATRAGGVGIWEYDVLNDKLIWDEQMYKLYGISNDKFDGAYKSWRNGLHPEDTLRCEQEVQMALRGEKEFNTEFRVLWPDGTIHFIRGIADVQYDPDGKPIGMIGTNWDITEKKNIDLQKEKSTEELENTNKFLIDRELKMTELKKEITYLKNQLANQAG